MKALLSLAAVLWMALLPARAADLAPPLLLGTNGVIRNYTNFFDANIDLLTDALDAAGYSSGGGGNANTNNATAWAQKQTFVGPVFVGTTNLVQKLAALDSGKQATDTDLDALAGLALTGVMVRTGVATYALRTLTGDSELLITNGDGVAGNPLFSLHSSIARDSEVAAAIAALASVYQPIDSDLTALAGLSQSGINVRTGAGTAAARTITGDAEIVVSNGDGVSGNPTLSIGAAIARAAAIAAAYQPIDSDLTALAGLSATGIHVRTGAGTAASRTLTGDTEIVVANGDGVSGNPTLSIGSAIARVAAMAAAYQPLSAVLTQLASLNGSGLTNLNASIAFSTGQVPIARLASGTPNGSKFIRDDGTLATPGGGGGGDAYLANSQTFTGPTNTFNGTLVASNASVGAMAVDSMTLGSPLGLGSGGGGATTAAGIRTNLQLVPDVNVQAFRLVLLQTALAITTDGDMPVMLSGIVTNLATTSAGRTLLTAVNAAAQRTALGLGTMATETAANYALLSGATFSGSANVPAFAYGVAWSNSMATVPASNIWKKIESMPGGSNSIISVSTDFELAGGNLSLSNTVGTGRIVRESAAGGGGGSTNAGRHLFSVHARDMFSGTNAAAQATDVIVGNGRAVARFSGSTDNERLFEGVIPAGANIAGGLKITVHFGSTNPVGSNVVWQLQLAPGTGTDPTTTTWNTAVKLTNALPGSIAITNAALNYADLAGITNRQPVIGRIMRDQGSASDTEAGGVDVRAVVLEILDSN